MRPAARLAAVAVILVSASLTSVLAQRSGVFLASRDHPSVRYSTAPVTDPVARLNRAIDLVREYRSRLIADVVTGKLDVREAAANLPDELPAPEDVGDVEDPELELAGEAEEIEESALANE